MRLKGKLELVWMMLLAVMLWQFRQVPVRADQWNKKTVLTVKETIQVPGATLTPGTYVFQLAESSADRHIVQVFNEEQDHLLTTILATPNERLKPTGNSEFGFWEVPQGTPPALRSWFYPGDNFGHEFSYPKSEAAQISELTKQDVPSISDEEQSSLSRGAQSGASVGLNTPVETQRAATASQTHTEAQVRPETKAVEASSTEPIAPAPVNTQSKSPDYPKAPKTTEVVSSDEAAQPSPGSQPLPRTASPIPMIGLLGCLSLGVSLALRRLRSSKVQ